jgi:hypothetical protein
MTSPPKPLPFSVVRYLLRDTNPGPTLVGEPEHIGDFTTFRKAEEAQERAREPGRACMICHRVNIRWDDATGPLDADWRFDWE